jgi:multimeric flavodoxin WrbA
MKLLGLSAGRKSGNGEILLKEALLAAQEVDGVEVEIVRLFDLEINPCTGCEGCTLSLAKGGSGDCVQWKDDDALWLRDKFGECDGLITAAPTFELRPSGNYCVMNDRFLGFSPKFLMSVHHRPQRPAAAIATGGSDWVQLALPQLSLAFFMLNMKMVDQYAATWIGRPGHVLLRDDHLERARKLGLRVAIAMKKPIDQAKYEGPEGACPSCHTNLLTLGKGGTAECPICGITAQVSMVDGEFSYQWDEKTHYRWDPVGAESHFKDILAKRMEFDRAKKEIAARMEKYKAFAPYARPERVA